MNTGFARATLSYSTLVSDRMRVTYSAQAEQLYDPAPWTPANENARVSVAIARLVNGGDQLTGRIRYATQSSDNLNERYQQLTAEMGYA